MNVIPKMLASIEVLLSSIIDYAGLFPPAQLNLQQVMVNYECYAMTSESWMLGNFVLPISRLNEFEELLPQFACQRWPLNLIFSQNWESELEEVRSLINRKILIAALEFPPLLPAEIEKVLSHLSSQVTTFFEIPFDGDLNAYLTVLKHTTASGKIRTGGINIEAFPSVTQLSQFILSFAQAKVSFKATAGLHHSLPAKRYITSELNSFSTNMHGFLNVVVLATLAYWQKASFEDALDILVEPSLNNFYFLKDGIYWKNYELSLAQLQESRKHFFRSFGSCSFQDPVADLKHLKLVK